MKFVALSRAILPIFSAVPFHSSLNVPLFLPPASLLLVYLSIVGGLFLVAGEASQVFVYGSVYGLVTLYVFYGRLPYSAKFIRVFCFLFALSLALFIGGIDFWATVRPTLFGKFHFFAREPSFLSEVFILLVTLTIAYGNAFDKLLVSFLGCVFLAISSSGTLVLWLLLVLVTCSILAFQRVVPSIHLVFLCITISAIGIFYLVATYSYLDGSWRAPSNFAVLTQYSPMKFVGARSLSEYYAVYEPSMNDLGLGSYFPGVFSLLPVIKFIFGDYVFFCFVAVFLRRIWVGLFRLRVYGVITAGVVLSGALWGLFFAPKWFPFAAIPMLTAMGAQRPTRLVKNS